MTKNKINVWPTYSLLGVLVVMLVGLGGFVYKNQQRLEQLAAEEPIKNSASLPVHEAEINKDTPWEIIYPNTKPMKIGEVDVKVSVAQNWPDRIKGLSDTPYLPEEVVKLFVFDSSGYPSIWMKDMNYPIDIIWVNEDSEIVYLEEEAAPESYPAMFVTDVPAKYVIETASGFVALNGISVGDTVELPKL